jgi:predicted ABC-type ATPase
LLAHQASARAARVARARRASRSGSVYVLAGCNGAGKSSIGGAALRQCGAEFFNPDEAARRIAAANVARHPPLSQAQINAMAWHEGRRLLRRAIDERADFAFETTLGGETMTALLEQAAQAGLAVHVWFVGLMDVELHIDRVRRRVAKGGHDIPAEKIRERFEKGRANLIRLLPQLTELHLYDNSAEADPDTGATPRPRLLVHCSERRIFSPTNLRSLLEATPGWAKAIVAACVKVHLAQRH